MNGRALHESALVFDGLVHYCDGRTEDLRAAHVDAINTTVCHFEADFPDACAQISAWIEIASKPGSGWRLVERASDIDAAKAAGETALVMGWQNCRPIADRLDRLWFFHRLGLRIMQLTYNYRNFLGDGCLEPEGAGLTTLGRDAVKLMNEIGIAIDLSHVGYRTSMDAIRVSTKPVLLTHANASAITDLERNKPDDLIRAVADSGGVIGASIYGPMCWNGDESRRPDISDYIRHLEHIVEVAGPEHVSFGTDLTSGRDLARIAFLRETPRRWEGINRFNRLFGEDIPSRYLNGCTSHADLWRVTEALVERGWSEEHIRGYLGENLRRVLAEIWGG